MVASIIPILAAHKFHSPIDDAYITFTYARSIAEGQGFRLHPLADPSLGTTTPFTAIILAILSRILFFLEIPTIGIGLSVAAWIGTAWLWFFKGQVFGLNLFGRFAVAIVLLVETSNWIVHLGMESWLFIFLLTFTVLIFLCQHMLFAGMSVAALFLTRPEGILLVPILIIYQGLFVDPKNIESIKHFGQQSVKLIAGFLVTFSIWAIFAWLTIGKIVPQTIKAKTIQSNMMDWGNFVDYLHIHLTENWMTLGSITSSYSVSLNAWLIMATIGILFAVIIARPTLILLLWVIGFIGVYFLIKAPYYTWYMLPIQYLLEVFSALAVAGLGTLCYQLINWSPRPRYRLISIPVYLIGLSFIAYSLVGYLPKATFGYPKKDYQQIAEWINSNTHQGDTVAYYEVGYLSWYSEREVVDLLGLTNSTVLDALDSGSTLLAFEATQPDYLVFLARHPLLSPIRQSGGFELLYDLVHTLPALDRAVGQTYEIYARKHPDVQPKMTAKDTTLDLNASSLVTHGVGKIETQHNGSVSFTPTIDPYLVYSELGLDAAQYDIVAITMSLSSTLEAQEAQLFFAQLGQPILEEHSTFFAVYPGDSRTYYIKVADRQGWIGTIDTIRFDPIEGASGDHNHITIEEIRVIRSQ